MKRRKIIIPVILVILILISIVGYKFFTTLKTVNERIEVRNFTSIPITEKEIKLINSKELSCAEYCELWELTEIPGESYGNLFEVIYYVKIERYNPLNDYYIASESDFSALTDEEQVFFSEVMSDTSSYAFETTDEGQNIAYCNVMLSGVTYNMSKEELEDIIRKVKIKLIIQDKNGRIFEKKVPLTEDAIIHETPTQGDIDLAETTLEEK